MWTAKRCKAVYEHLDSEGYNWYTLLYDRTNGKPYLGRRVPQVDQYNTQRDKYDISLPTTIVEPEEGISFPKLEKGKQPEY